MVSVYDIRCSNCGHVFDEGLNPYNMTVVCPVCEHEIGELKLIFEPYVFPIRRVAL